MAALYQAVRDKIRYDPYCIRPDPNFFRASAALKTGRGHCVGKAVLLRRRLELRAFRCVLVLRTCATNSRCPQLRKLLATDVFYRHGYSEIWLDGHWFKATPVFNLSLCEKFGIRPLEFDGPEDSIFDPFDSSGRQHMQYVKDRGPHLDLPFDDMMAVYRRRNPVMFLESPPKLTGDVEGGGGVLAALPANETIHFQ